MFDLTPAEMKHIALLATGWEFVWLKGRGWRFTNPSYPSHIITGSWRTTELLTKRKIIRQVETPDGWVFRFRQGTGERARDYVLNPPENKEPLAKLKWQGFSDTEAGVFLNVSRSAISRKRGRS